MKFSLLEYDKNLYAIVIKNNLQMIGCGFVVEFQGNGSMKLCQSVSSKQSLARLGMLDKITEI